MATQCHNQLTLSFQPKIVLDFNGGEITSDSGLLLLRQFDAQLALTKKLVGLFNDWRYPSFIEHSTHEMLCQRIYQIAAGYHDQNDADTLRSDAIFQTVVGRSDALASQPTLSRLENHADWQSIRRLSELCLKWFLHHGYGKNENPEEILLDSDSTDDPCHGQQQLAFFHGKYGEHMYHPLFFFDAKTGALLSARLRAGNASASEGIAAELRRLVPALKRRFPESQISYRADAGSATPQIYQTLESLDMLYAIGIATNAVFKRKTEPWLKKAKRKYACTKTPIRVFYSFRHRARSWRRQRRIVVKIEVGGLGVNLRFVVTNRAGRAEQIFNAYDERGECENRIKEFKRDLSSDRLSCHRYRANAFRLQLHALAYQLLVLFRLHALRKTQLAHARLETLRLKLFKVGARFKRTARHLWFHLSSSWPRRELFMEVWQTLKGLLPAAPS
ncbi:MAG TPA: IS1380 family transposase [Candidatus Nitrosocosmicus sp.]|nr:IS1380 family transposase [Candidatus Nitrosocosmicus sp.]